MAVFVQNEFDVTTLRGSPIQSLYEMPSLNDDILKQEKAKTALFFLKKFHLSKEEFLMQDIEATLAHANYSDADTEKEISWLINNNLQFQDVYFNLLDFKGPSNSSSTQIFKSLSNSAAVNIYQNLTRKLNENKFFEVVSVFINLNRPIPQVFAQAISSNEEIKKQLFRQAHQSKSLFKRVFNFLFGAYQREFNLLNSMISLIIIKANLAKGSRNEGHETLVNSNNMQQSEEARTPCQSVLIRTPTFDRTAQTLRDYSPKLGMGTPPVLLGIDTPQSAIHTPRNFSFWQDGATSFQAQEVYTPLSAIRPSSAAWQTVDVQTPVSAMRPSLSDEVITPLSAKQSSLTSVSGARESFLRSAMPRRNLLAEFDKFAPSVTP